MTVFTHTDMTVFTHRHPSLLFIGLTDSADMTAACSCHQSTVQTLNSSQHTSVAIWQT